ncbi:MAG: FkbM family methyltransferase [Parachlamydiaceae bacterium]|nr:FkbM family methyltransferase [Parachlamydiaceae bacterium]
MNIQKRPIANILVSSGHGTFIVNRHDYRTSDNVSIGVGHQILQNSYYEPEEVLYLKEILMLRREMFGDGVLAIDGGANIGVHTIEWAKTMHGWGSVLAFEAQERIFYCLAGNIAINNCFNATAYHAALGTSFGTINIPILDYFKSSSFGSFELRKNEFNEYIGQKIDYTADQCQKISMVAIDSLNLARVDFIKLDIEGMELEALEGAKKTIAATKPIMLIEYIKAGKETLENYLANFFYNTFEVDGSILAIHKDDPCKLKIEQRLSEEGYK